MHAAVAHVSQRFFPPAPFAFIMPLTTIFMEWENDYARFLVKSMTSRAAATSITEDFEFIYSSL